MVGQTKAGEFVIVSLDDLVKAIADKQAVSSSANFA
jgi:hypothetical protein